MRDLHVRHKILCETSFRYNIRCHYCQVFQWLSNNKYYRTTVCLWLSHKRVSGVSSSQSHEFNAVNVFILIQNWNFRRVYSAHQVAHP